MKHILLQEIPTTLINAIQERAKAHLQHARENYDVPHTELVVSYVLELLQQPEVPQKDVLIMYTAAWFHDTGNDGLFQSNKESHTLNSVLDRKKTHMEKSEQYIRDFFASSPQIDKAYTKEQQERIAHLVSVHDNIPILTDADELILMEADSLGALKQNMLTTNASSLFSVEDSKNYIRHHIVGKRAVKFFTTYGKRLLRELTRAYIEKYIPSGERRDFLQEKSISDFFAGQ